jgi:hypothetical protein
MSKNKKSLIFVIFRANLKPETCNLNRISAATEQHSAMSRFHRRNEAESKIVNGT